MKKLGYALGIVLLSAILIGQSYIGQAETIKASLVHDGSPLSEPVALELKTDKTSVKVGESFNLQVAVKTSSDTSNLSKVGYPADGYVCLSPTNGSWKLWLISDNLGNMSLSPNQTPLVSSWSVATFDWLNLTQVVVPLDETLVGTYNITGYLVPANYSISGSGSSVQVTVTSANSSGSGTPMPDMVQLPGGTFPMGDSVVATPIHDVTVSSFSIGKYEVTNTEYCAFLNDTGNSDHFFSAMSITNSSGVYTPKSGFENHPVVYLNWTDATHYCQWLSTKTGQNYTLPTDAQWEYACRAGTTTKYSFGDTIDSTKANYHTSGTTAVGSYSANPFGLYDMHGNVEEWCADWLGGYTDEPQVNPTGPSSGSMRVLRGGGWHDIKYDYIYYSAGRRGLTPSSRSDYCGFRVAINN